MPSFRNSGSGLMQGRMSFVEGNAGYDGLQDGNKVAFPADRVGGNEYTYRATTSITNLPEGDFNSNDNLILNLDNFDCDNGSEIVDFSEGMYQTCQTMYFIDSDSHLDFVLLAIEKLGFCTLTIEGVPSTDDMLANNARGEVSFVEGNDVYQGLRDGDGVVLPRSRSGGDTYKVIATTSLQTSPSTIGNFNSMVFDLTLPDCSSGTATLDFTDGKNEIQFSSLFRW